MEPHAPRRSPASRRDIFAEPLTTDDGTIFVSIGVGEDPDAPHSFVLQHDTEGAGFVLVDCARGTVLHRAATVEASLKAFARARLVATEAPPCEPAAPPLAPVPAPGGQSKRQAAEDQRRRRVEASYRLMMRDPLRGRRGIVAMVLWTDAGEPFGSLEIEGTFGPSLSVLQRDGTAWVVADSASGQVLSRANAGSTALRHWLRTLPGAGSRAARTAQRR